jgi:aspartate racemase
MASNSPPTIGLIGGMSWESTAKYYRLANVLTRERLGGLHSARIVAISLDFADIEPLQAAGQWHEAGQILAAAAQRLEAAGADLALICTNTMHIVADQVQAAIGIPLLHIADVAATSVTSAGLTTVGLLGTAFTMEKTYYRSRVESHGLTVLIPPPDDRAAVHRVIYDELCLGQLREESRQLYREVIGRMVTDGAEGIILGCTEIELLVSAADSPVPIFPTTRLHVMAALDAGRAADAGTKPPSGSGGAATSDPSHRSPANLHPAHTP